MSEIRANTVSNAAGTGPATLTKQSAAKTWCVFNGTGTVAILDSFNVSSLADGGVATYTITRTGAFASSNYSWAGSARSSAGGTMVSVPNGGVISTTQILLLPVRSDNGAYDCDRVTLQEHGDLA